HNTRKCRHIRGLLRPPFPQKLKNRDTLGRSKGRDTVAFRSFMYYSRHAGRRAFRWAKFWWWPFVLLASAWVPSGVWASCLENPDPEIRRLQEMVDEDATKALKQSKTL